MTANIVFFPVGNGDMTLIELESGSKILIDTKIRQEADDSDKDTPDVASMLRQRLERDSQGRLYIDVFLLTHPDEDHCLGLNKHFHLGHPEKHSADKIFIREIWSSPMVFRRASKNLTLSEDAKAFHSEARRRVSLFREKQYTDEGNRIQILGKDENGKTDDLTNILVKVDDYITKINGQDDSSFKALLLGPLPKSDDENQEDLLVKNRSSVIIQFSLSNKGVTDACQFLISGDAGVEVWERLWEKHNNSHNLEYDLLLAPHHCSWRSLSHDSWSELGEEVKVSPKALQALSQAKRGASIISSSKAVSEEDSDPPCIRAKREYESILKKSEVKGRFFCTGEYPKPSNLNPMIWEIEYHGPRLTSQPMSNSAIQFSEGIGKQPLAHG